jgi:kynurenine formamidase
MITTISFQNKKYQANLKLPLDISIPLHQGKNNVHAWFVNAARFEPVKIGNWVGDVLQGAAVNFRDIYFNPHGHGTHTECVGHISKEIYTINQCLKNFFFVAQVITIEPQKVGDDYIIQLAQIIEAELTAGIEAIVIRTLPNLDIKLRQHYSNQNPPFIAADAMQYIVNKGINHFLIDLPSVDKEKDDGKLLAHHAFWEYPHNTKAERTITELIFVPNDIANGHYLLNLQISSFENDAAPSKPVLYAMQSI